MIFQILAFGVMALLGVYGAFKFKNEWQVYDHETMRRRLGRQWEYRSMTDDEKAFDADMRAW